MMVPTQCGFYKDVAAPCIVNPPADNLILSSIETFTPETNQIRAVNINNICTDNVLNKPLMVIVKIIIKKSM
jgi:hypothetical protein